MGNDTLAHQAKVRCFGNRAALTAEATWLTREGVEPVPTMNLEVAPRNGADVDWSKKIVLQLSEQELPLLCAVFMGYLSALHLKRPGKGIELERQTGGIFIKASAGRGTLYALPASPGDAFRLNALFLTRLKQQTRIDDGTLLLAALRGAASL